MNFIEGKIEAGVYFVFGQQKVKMPARMAGGVGGVCWGSRWCWGCVRREFSPANEEVQLGGELHLLRN